MIRLRPSLLAGLTGPAPDPARVQASLQQAIQLEHATIPPYLYALYSLDEAKNPQIAALIASVVMQEMLHMTLASNVLNAIGGSPAIDGAAFVPVYPRPLPGGVESDLVVGLRPFSMQQLDTFITIEEPEDPLNFRVEALALAQAQQQLTIGQFYTAISHAIGQLGPGIFVAPPRNQVGPDLMPGSVQVIDVPSAQRAIQTIIDQGEGTSASPDAGAGGGGHAHYYRFMEIKKGRLLVKVGDGPDPSENWTYSGAPVAFDRTGVHAAPSNPGKPPGYPAGSAQAFANDNFNYTYTSLLKVLHDLLNGHATRAQFNRSIGLMMSLKGQAKAMMSGIPNPAVICGPSFQYQPVNPRRPATPALAHV
ncbi:MAG TPA: ferritin-like protein [Caulobacteraceae bacterium]|jgi:hypothetical protein